MEKWPRVDAVEAGSKHCFGRTKPLMIQGGRLEVTVRESLGTKKWEMTFHTEGLRTDAFSRGKQREEDD